MKLNKQIFKAYDIRGLVEEVTPEIARCVGAGLAHALGCKTMVVGRDMRATSPELYEATIEGIRSQGVHVKALGECTTSLFNYAVSARSEIDGGIIITASHNPKEYNGIKAARSTGEVVSGEELYVYARNQLETGRNTGDREEVDWKEEYLDARLKQAGTLKVEGVRVAVDFGNGMGALTLLPLLARLGVEVHSLYEQPDANFPHHEANPAKMDTYSDLQTLIKTVHADFGIAIDGDGDRIGFVDENGRIILGDILLALFAKAALQDHPGALILTQPNHSWTTRMVIEQYGGQAVPCRIGRTFMVNVMKKKNALLGGELSSHFFFQECGGLESIDFALVRMLQIYTQAQRPFSQLINELPLFFKSEEQNFEISDAQNVFEALEHVYGPKATRIDRLDGLKFEFEDWWVIVRASNTEPLMRMTLEAKTQECLQEKMAQLQEFMLKFSV